MRLCPACQNTYPDDYQTCPRDQAALMDAGIEIVPGTILRGKYEILSEIGAGGMAVVYKVRHRTFQELCAVKIVHKHFMHDPSFVKRFRNEAVVARQLKHPNAVRVDDFDYTDDGRPFIVMEYVEGVSLYEVRKTRHSPWPVDRCINIVSQIAAALCAAHTLGIVHRDIKPSNVLLLRGASGEAQVKVLDFGIAKVRDGAFAGMTSVRTQQSLIIGTPEYMSPEQASGRLDSGIDGRADLYSLGLVFYEMLTGSHPFRADTPMGMLIQQLHTLPPPPGSLGVDLPPGVSALVLKALQKDPHDRFQSAAEMLAALENPEGWAGSRTEVASVRSRVEPTDLKPQATAAGSMRIPQPPSTDRTALFPEGSAASSNKNKVAADTRPAMSLRLLWAVPAVVVLVASIVIAAARFLGHSTHGSVQTASTPTPQAAPRPVQTPPPKIENVDNEAQITKLLASGTRSLAARNYDIATQFFLQALSLDGNNAEALSGLQAAKAGSSAASAVAKGAPPSGRSAAGEVGARNQAQLAKLIASGNQSLASRDYDIAAQFFQQALSLDSNNAQALAGMRKAKAESPNTSDNQ